MRLRSLYIDGFGVWRGYGVPELHRGLTVFHGPNEAGKSTLVAFLRWMFYGFAGGRSRENRYPPLRGGRHGGWVEVTGGTTDEPLCRIERYRNSRPEVSLQSLDGVPRGPEALPGLLGNIDKQVFFNVFAFSLDELNRFDSLTGDQIKQRLYSAPMQGSGVAPQEVITALDARRAEMYTRNANSQAKANLLSRQVSEATARLRAAQSQVDEFQRIEAQIADFAAQKEACQQTLRDLTTERHQVGQLASLWPNWRNLRDLQERLASLPVIPSMPRDGDTRLAEAESRLAQVREAHAETLAGLQQHQMALQQLPARDGIIDHQVVLKGLFDRRMLVADWLGKLKALEAEVTNAEKDLADAIRQLGATWTPERIAALDVSLSQQSAVRDWATRLQTTAELEKDAARRLETHENELRRLQQTLAELPESADADLALVKERLVAESDAVSRLRSLLRDHDRMAADIRHLDEQISDLEATIRQLGQRTSGPAPSAKRSIFFWMAAGVMAVAALGLMAAGYLQLGMGLLLGAVVVVIVGMTMGRTSRTSDTDGATLASLETKLADRRKQRDVVVADHQAIESRMTEPAGRLNLSLPLDPGQLDQAGSRVDRAMLQLQGDTDRQMQRLTKVKQVEGQTSLVSEHAQALQTARQAVTTAQQGWLAWKQAQGVDKHLQPEAALDLIRIVTRAQELLARAAGCRGERNAMQGNVGGYCAEAGGLLEKVGQSVATDPNEVVKLVEAMQARLASAESIEEKRLSAESALTNLQPRVERERATIDQFEGEQAELLAAAGAETAELFRERWQVWIERQRLDRSVQEADAVLKESVGEDEVARQIRAKLATGERIRWERESQELDLQLAESREALEQVVRGHQAALQDWDRLARSADVAAEANVQAALAEELGQAVRQWRVITLALSLVQATLGTYERERQPAVLQRASQHFQAVTAGAYDSVRARDQQIVVVDRNGGEHTVETLSRGTAEQLYLTMRLGLAAEMAKQNGGLPLIMDDVLVNFDEARAQRVAEVLATVGRDLQILLFTCHESTVSAFQAIDPDITVVSLPQFGGLEAPAATVMVGDDDDDGDESVVATSGGRIYVDDARLAEVCAQIEDLLRQLPGQGKAAIVAATGISETEWRKAVDVLKGENRIGQVGNKKAAKYYLPDQLPEGPEAAPDQEVLQEPAEFAP